MTMILNRILLRCNGLIRSIASYNNYSTVNKNALRYTKSSDLVWRRISVIKPTGI